jgi:hypothetical protein
MKGFMRTSMIYFIGCMGASRKADGVCLSYPEYKVFISDLEPGDYVLSRGGKGNRFLFMGTRVRPLVTARSLSEQIREYQTALLGPFSPSPPQSGQAGAVK